MVGTTEILIISGVVLLLFGSAAIPKFFRSMGKAKSEFQKGVQEAGEEEEKETDKKKSKK